MKFMEQAPKKSILLFFCHEFFEVFNLNSQISLIQILINYWQENSYNLIISMIDDETFKMQITKHDQIKLWAKKLQMLKQGLLDQRQSKKQLMDEFQLKRQRYGKLKGQIEWKNRQNQTLGKQIKGIKDQILQQRNKKRKLREQLIVLTQGNQSGSDQAKTNDI